MSENKIKQHLTATIEDKDAVSGVDALVNQAKSKVDEVPKLNKKAIFALVGVSVATIGIIAGGFLFYRHAENTKPVGNDKKIVSQVRGEETVKAKPLKEEIKVVSGDKLTDRGYDMLWQSRVPLVDNGKSEFPDPDQFRANLLELLQTGDAKDINQAAALWSKNRLNYAFTSNANLSAAAIGHDALMLDKYMTLVDGVAYAGRAKQDIKLARQINSDFQSPWLMAMYGGNLHLSATAELVKDRNSVQLNLMYVNLIEGVELRQYDQSSLDKATMIEYRFNSTNEGPNMMSNQKFNKVREAWDSTGSINRVYEVIIRTPKRNAVVVLTEDRTGDLNVYGTYFDVITLEDTIISIADQEVVGEVKDAPQDTKPQNWEQFQDQVEEYFGN